MTEQRGYQHNYSSLSESMHDNVLREQKAATMTAVLGDYFSRPLNDLRVLDIGASTGIIDNYLAQHFQSVVGIDIDSKAIEFANNTFNKENLRFCVGDALDTKQTEASFDVVICSQIYEHVPDAPAMMAEIFRVLKPGGVCYFAAGNRIMWNEPHYKLPLLSVIPRPLAHRYVRLSGKADHYHELHLSYWGLKKLVSKFERIDYTKCMLSDPEKFKIDYMTKAGSLKQVTAVTISKMAPWLLPGYIWLLRKP